MRPFPTLILAMSLASTFTLAYADVADAAAQESVRVISNQQVRAMKIRMDVEGTVITATLEDNATSRDFLSLLPLTLTLQDYAATEKISDPPRRLSTAGAPPGSDPSPGDISYYAPWGNLALFYSDSGYASGLVKLGKLDSGVEALHRAGPLQVTIEVIEK
jgi:hypothetical protein